MVYQATIYLDDGDCPIAQEGPSEDFTTLGKARQWAKQQVSTRTRYSTVPEDGFWYGSIQRGRYVDPIGDGLPYDLTFEPDPGWSEVVRSPHVEISSLARGVDDAPDSETDF